MKNNHFSIQQKRNLEFAATILHHNVLYSVLSLSDVNSYIFFVRFFRFMLGFSDLRFLPALLFSASSKEQATMRYLVTGMLVHFFFLKLSCIKVTCIF